MQHQKCLDQLLAQSLPVSFVVAYSGGVDSHVALHYLRQRVIDTPHSLSAIHIHHGLNPKADEWLEHCQSVCHALEIPFSFAKLTLQINKRESLEAVAREARYQAIVQHTQESDVIVLGQHQDDQLETFLLQLRRGAGPKGLSGMAADFVRHQRRFIRPLLGCSQHHITTYANQFELQWVEDDSNWDTRFERNFLRQEIIPLITQRWPQFPSAVERSAGLCAEQQFLLEEETQIKLDACLESATQLDSIRLCDYSQAWQKQILRSWFTRLDMRLPSAALMEQILSQFANSTDDATPEIYLDGWWLRRYQKKWMLEREESQKPPASVEWIADLEVPVSHDHVFVLRRAVDGVDEPDKLIYIQPEEDVVEIRFGGLSQKFKPKGHSLSRTLKHWFKLWKLPPWKRQQVPLVFVNKQLVAVSEFAVSEVEHPKEGTEAFVGRILQRG